MTNSQTPQEKTYTAFYETYFGGESLGHFQEDPLPTKDTYTFSAKDDAEAINIATSYDAHKKVINDRFTKKTPELTRLLESREVDISGLTKKIKSD